MKNFFTKKRAIYLLAIIISLITLVILLFFPIKSNSTKCVVYYLHDHSIHTLDAGYLIGPALTSPFTIGEGEWTLVLVSQTIVFTLVSIVFIVFTILFAIELKQANVFARRESKSARLEQRMAELEKEVEDLKKGE